MLSPMKLTGRVSRGYRIASGMNTEGVPGPTGEMLRDSFVRQRVFFEKEIPELTQVWTGTINLDISPNEVRMDEFDHTVTCEWHPGIVETFGIVSGVTLHAKGKTFENCFIYYPMPSDIHTPRYEIVELLAPKVEGLSYGDEISIEVPEGKITFIEKKKNGATL